jgi:hypothetical protein
LHAALAILLPEQTAATIVGDLGVAFVMMLNASPLVAIKTVIDEKSADSIPLSFTLASIACCFFWSIVGIEQLHDWVVYFPNMMGLCFGFFSLDSNSCTVMWMTKRLLVLKAVWHQRRLHVSSYYRKASKRGDMDNHTYLGTRDITMDTQYKKDRANQKDQYLHVL